MLIVVILTHLYILDALPCVCRQMKHPEVLIVVELLSIWGGKLSSKHPELPTPLGNGHSLEGSREGGVKADTQPPPSARVRSTDQQTRGQRPGKSLQLLQFLGEKCFRCI